MIENKVDLDIGHLKPTMKALKSIDDIPSKLVHEGKIALDSKEKVVVMVKADGMFSVAYYDTKTCYTVNDYGILRSDFPAINELCATLRGRGLMEAVLLCEIYGVDADGRPIILPRFMHTLKGKGTDHTRIRIGVWDLLRTDGALVQMDYGWKMDEVSEWLEGCRYCHVLPYIKPESLGEIREFWKRHVEEGGYEGLVVRVGGEIYKIKPSRDVDAVIIGLNKRELFSQKQITSLKLALMDGDGSFVVLGDVASGIDHELRSFLWRLMEYRVGEDEECVYIKPFVIVTVEYTETFESVKEKLRFKDGQYIKDGEMAFYSLRHPRLVGFRRDKKVNPRDLRLSQI